MAPRIPDSEYTIEFSRASGPGGQNVNKVSTRAQLRWRVGDSTVLSKEQKGRIRLFLQNRLTNNDEILVISEEERSQAQNKERVRVRFQELINQALFVPKKRRPTKPTRSSQEKRLEKKRLTSEKKRLRRGAIL